MARVLDEDELIEHWTLVDGAQVVERGAQAGPVSGGLPGAGLLFVDPAASGGAEVADWRLVSGDVACAAMDGRDLFGMLSALQRRPAKPCSSTNPARRPPRQAELDMSTHLDLGLDQTIEGR